MDLCKFSEWGKVKGDIMGGAGGYIRKVVYKGKTYVIKTVILRYKSSKSQLMNSIKVINFLQRKDKQFSGIIRYYGYKFCKDPILAPALVFVQAMDFYPWTLKRYTEVKRPDAKWWYKVIDEILDIIKQLKKYRINHNDINPGNVVIDKEKVKLLDWDLATIKGKHFDPNYDISKFYATTFDPNVANYFNGEKFFKAIPEEVIEYTKKHIKPDNYTSQLVYVKE